MNKFLKFCIVGGAGFVVDTGVYYLANIIMPVLISRLISFTAAVLFTYYFNRRFTFKKQTSMNLSEFLKYYSAMVLGGSVNVGSFWILMYFNSMVSNYPIFGIAFGSIAGLFVNYITSRIIIFK